MSSDISRFEKTALAAKALPDRPDNETLLRLYALYKQGSDGDVSGDNPGFLTLSDWPNTRPGKK